VPLRVGESSGPARSLSRDGAGTAGIPLMQPEIGSPRAPPYGPSKDQPGLGGRRDSAGLEETELQNEIETAEFLPVLPVRTRPHSGIVRRPRGAKRCRRSDPDGATYTDEMRIVEVDASEMDVANGEPAHGALSNAAKSGAAECVAVLEPRFTGNVSATALT